MRLKFLWCGRLLSLDRRAMTLSGGRGPSASPWPPRSAPASPGGSTCSMNKHRPAPSATTTASRHPVSNSRPVRNHPDRCGRSTTRDTIRAADHLSTIGAGGRRTWRPHRGWRSLQNLAGRRKTPSPVPSQRSPLDPTPPERRKRRQPQARSGAVPPQQPSDLDLDIPLGRLVCITGVRRRGKPATLVNELLHPPWSIKLGPQGPVPSGLQELARDQVRIESDRDRQSRSPHAPLQSRHLHPVPFDPIRQVFAPPWRPRPRGYQVGQFSFNVKGGRCRGLQAARRNVIEMNSCPMCMCSAMLQGARLQPRNPPGGLQGPHHHARCRR